MQLLQMIKQSVETAYMKSVGKQKGNDARENSRNFVIALAEHFRKEFSEESFRVFFRDDSGQQNRPDFKLNEMLYDILVCMVNPVKSCEREIDLYYIQRAIWQIESELRHDGREAVKDFSKLVLGSAPYKLFIGPQVKNNERFLAMLRPAACACSGEVYAALISDPKNWEKDKGVDLWCLKGGFWLKTTL